MHIFFTIFLFSVAPRIAVSDVTNEQNEATRTITCLPVGNPSIYTYYKWQHKSKYGVLIRNFVIILN